MTLLSIFADMWHMLGLSQKFHDALFCFCCFVLKKKMASSQEKRERVKRVVVADKISERLPGEALRMDASAPKVDLVEANREHECYYQVLKKIGVEVLKVFFCFCFQNSSLKRSYFSSFYLSSLSLYPPKKTMKF